MAGSSMEGAATGGQEPLMTQTASGELLEVPDCAKCKHLEADFECFNCQASFCAPCWDGCHEWGENKFHTKNVVAKPSLPCEGYSVGDCPVHAAAAGYCGVCDQVLCLSCWDGLHSKGTRKKHEKLAPLGRAAYLEAQKELKSAGEKGGPFFALAAFDPLKAPPWVAGIIADRRQLEHARRVGLGVAVSSMSGETVRASAGATRYKSIQSHAPATIAEQLQRVCSEPGSGAYTDVSIKGYATDRQADVDAIATVLNTVTKKTSVTLTVTSDNRSKTLLDRLLDYERRIKVALASRKEVDFNRDESGKGLERIVAAITSARAQVEGIQVNLLICSPVQLRLYSLYPLPALSRTKLSNLGDRHFVVKARASLAWTQTAPEALGLIYAIARRMEGVCLRRITNTFNAYWTSSLLVSCGLICRTD
jgi:hypothetical protein